VVPRQWAPGAADGSLLRELVRRVARPLLDPRAPMMLVTSWNEWNEDTALEPLAPAPATAADTSGSGRAFTQGYSYQGGAGALEALRDEVVAVGGVVTDGGRPVDGIVVEAYRGGRLLAADTTDHQGRYTLSRWLVEPGPVEVRAVARRADDEAAAEAEQSTVAEAVAEVTVEPDRTAFADLAVDLALAG
jgi:hypothetical protein